MKGISVRQMLVEEIPKVLDIVLSLLVKGREVLVVGNDFVQVEEVLTVGTYDIVGI